MHQSRLSMCHQRRITLLHTSSSTHAKVSEVESTKSGDESHAQLTHLIWVQHGSHATMQPSACAAIMVTGLLVSSNSPTKGSIAPCCPKAVQYSTLLCARSLQCSQVSLGSDARERGSQIKHRILYLLCCRFLDCSIL